jgi:GntR family transcriptional regulator
MAQQRKTRPAYKELSLKLRAAIERGEFDDSKPLPTEAELSRTYQISRHTVRQAFHDLVAEGLVRRTPGRGTFVTSLSKRGKYLRSIGSIEELMSWPGTRMEVLEPVSIVTDAEASTRLEVPGEEVATLIVRRLYGEVPFVVTLVYLHPEVGKQMGDQDRPTEHDSTVLDVLEGLIPYPISRVSQSITAKSLPRELANHINYEADKPALHVERLYFDTEGHPVELATSFYNPNRYSYRLELQRMASH